MKWKKLGLVYGPDGSLSWAKSHAYCPTVYQSHRGCRVYFSSWDSDGRGRIGYVELDSKDLTKIIRVGKKPVLDLGKPGNFDCDGVAPSQLIRIYDVLYMYYFGFQRTSNGIDLIFGGVAQSYDDGLTFKRVYETPVLDRRPTESLFRSSMFLFPQKGRLSLFYTASLTESKRRGKMYKDKRLPDYTIKRMIPQNHLDFSGPGEVFIEPTEKAFGICRPWIWHDNLSWKEYNKYFFFYSQRATNKNYRIRALESMDGDVWKEIPSGITTSKRGFDNNMVCFPSVANVYGKATMFYNGNEHGKEGFGVAHWDDHKKHTNPRRKA